MCPKVTCSLSLVPLVTFLSARRNLASICAYSLAGLCSAKGSATGTGVPSAKLLKPANSLSCASTSPHSLSSPNPAASLTVATPYPSFAMCEAQKSPSASASLLSAASRAPTSAMALVERRDAAPRPTAARVAPRVRFLHLGGPTQSCSMYDASRGSPGNQTSHSTTSTLLAFPATLPQKRGDLKSAARCATRSTTGVCSPAAPCSPGASGAASASLLRCVYLTLCTLMRLERR
mmetsp:Transcript_3645/g.12707  ORF Transcript_3645/g.12707 Transcript_3645/m.12707 type:complete len:234 (-) Transcript_3645:478-1179(-)